MSVHCSPGCIARHHECCKFSSVNKLVEFGPRASPFYNIEFAREKETLFDRWCSSTKVGSDYEKLRELVLLKEFKRSVSKEIKIHLEETKVASLKQAAIMADDYDLTHKNSFVRNTGYPSHKGYQESRGYRP